MPDYYQGISHYCIINREPCCQLGCPKLGRHGPSRNHYSTSQPPRETVMDFLRQCLCWGHCGGSYPVDPFLFPINQKGSSSYSSHLCSWFGVSRILAASGTPLLLPRQPRLEPTTSREDRPETDPHPLLVAREARHCPLQLRHRQSFSSERLGKKTTHQQEQKQNLARAVLNFRSVAWRLAAFFAAFSVS